MAAWHTSCPWSDHLELRVVAGIGAGVVRIKLRDQSMSVTWICRVCCIWGQNRWSWQDRLEQRRTHVDHTTHWDRTLRLPKLSILISHMNAPKKGSSRLLWLEKILKLIRWKLWASSGSQQRVSGPTEGCDQTCHRQHDGGQGCFWPVSGRVEEHANGWYRAEETSLPIPHELCEDTAWIGYSRREYIR